MAGRADRRAQFRHLEEEKQCNDDGQGHAYDDQKMQVEMQLAERHDRLRRRDLHLQRVRSPDPDHAVLDREDQAERGDHLVSQVAAQRAEYRMLQRKAEHREHRHRQHYRERIAPGDFRQDEVTNIGTDGEKHAVGEVEHVHHAVDEHHAQRDEHVDRPHHEAVDDLL